MNIVILTGAGISADSGVPTFRDRNGLWERFDWQRLATPEAFAETPDEVHAFYNLRRSALSSTEPNAAHIALVRLEQALTAKGHGFSLITQNVDDLHRRAGSTDVLAMHGSLDQVRCEACGHVYSSLAALSKEDPCPDCRSKGTLRPDIVWFGEIPKGLSTIEAAMASATEFWAIGTSGSVYPAAGLVAEANRRHIKTTELNLEPSDNAALFDHAVYGRAAEIVPAFVDQVVHALS